jgi:twitching motility protein PilT
MKQFQEILTRARELKASDIHLTSKETICLRIDGELHKTELTLSDFQLGEIVRQVLNEEQYLNLEQGKEVDVAYIDAQKRSYRINASKSKGSFVLVIRLIADTVPACEELGLPKEIMTLTELKQGLVLVCGATGSGKSTTLAALINKLNCERKVHIITLEDPIEYRHENVKALIHQREVGSDTTSFVNGLRSALRQDPDVILLGELRDRETTAAALTAAETGHLVFATLHTKEATGAINRILDMFDEGRELIKSQLANVLEAIICQELVKKKEGTGRRAVFELLLATPALRSLIREGRSHQINGYQLVKSYR